MRRVGVVVVGSGVGVGNGGFVGTVVGVGVEGRGVAVGAGSSVASMAATRFWR